MFGVGRGARFELDVFVLVHFDDTACVGELAMTMSSLYVSETLPNDERLAVWSQHDDAAVCYFDQSLASTQSLLSRTNSTVSIIKKNTNRHRTKL